MTTERDDSHARSVGLYCLLVLLAVGSVTVPAGATPDSQADTSSPTVTVATPNETLGDVVTVSVSLPAGDNATLVVNATNDTYSQQVRVNDTTHDGTVTVALNSFLGQSNGSADGIYRAVSGDELTVPNRTETELGTGEYRLSVYPDGNTSTAPANTSQFRLSPPTYGNVTVMFAPGNSTDRLDDREAIQRGREDGWVTTTEDVTTQDTLVLRLDVDGIGGAVTTPGNESSALERLLSQPNTTLMATSGFGQTHVPPTTVVLDNTSTMALVPDRANDTYYVVVPADVVRQGLDSSMDFEDGDSVELGLTVDGRPRLSNTSDYYDAGVTEFDVEEPEVHLSTDVRDSLDWDPITIQGETSVAPGSRLVVRLRSDNGTVESWTRTVDIDGRFTVTVAAETVRGATNATLDVLDNGTTIRTVDQRASLTVPSDQSLDDGQLLVASATLPDEGYIHVVGPEGSVVGVSDYLGEGDHTNVSISTTVTSIGPDESLVVVPVEENIDPDSVGYDEAFLVDGPPAGVVVNVTDRATRDTATATEERTDAATPTATASTDHQTTATHADGPGFGVVATLVAVGLAVLARVDREC